MPLGVTNMVPPNRVALLGPAVPRWCEKPMAASMRPGGIASIFASTFEGVLVESLPYARSASTRSPTPARRSGHATT